MEALLILLAITAVLWFIIAKIRKHSNSDKRAKKKLSKIEQQLAATQAEATQAINELQAQYDSAAAEYNDVAKALDEIQQAYEGKVTAYKLEANKLEIQHQAVLDELNQQYIEDKKKISEWTNTLYGNWKRENEKIAEEKEESQKEFNELQERYNSLQAKYNVDQNELQTSYEAARATIDEEIQKLRDQCDKEIEEYKNAIDEWEKKTNQVKGTYFSLLDAINQEETERTKNLLLIPDQDKQDIKYLLSEVAPRFHNKDTIYKLIWSEYFQAPAKEMLTKILPTTDCSGIYKITNLSNKKCYVGRSTDVKRRLNDHIKSAIGIESIANQKVHDVMREEGIWNFSFELLEACEKTQLGDREKYYIDFFKADNPNYGYNVVSGSAFKAAKED